MQREPYQFKQLCFIISNGNAVRMITFTYILPANNKKASKKTKRVTLHSLEKLDRGWPNFPILKDGCWIDKSQ